MPQVFYFDTYNIFYELYSVENRLYKYISFHVLNRTIIQITRNSFHKRHFKAIYKHLSRIHEKSKSEIYFTIHEND